MRVKS